jgi:hypothetical protein
MVPQLSVPLFDDGSKVVSKYAGARFHVARRKIRRGLRRLLELEQLENRCLLQAPVGQWTPIGPAPQHDLNSKLEPGAQDMTGRISALAVATINGNQQALFVGAAGGGLWRSTDFANGRPTWTPLTDNIGIQDPSTGLGAGAIDVGSIAVVYTKSLANPIIYVGTGEPNAPEGGTFAFGTVRYGAGILISTDGGNSWSLSPGPINPGGSGLPAFFRHSISKIIADPRNPAVLYASVVSDGTDATTKDKDDFGNATGRPNLTQDNGIYKTTNYGATWTRITFGRLSTPRVPNFNIGAGAIVTDLEYTLEPVTNRLTLYAGVENSSTTANDVGGIWWSNDEGAHWSQFGALAHYGVGPPGGLNAPTGANVGRIALASDHKNAVYAAVANRTGVTGVRLSDVLQSSDNGVSWTSIMPNTWNNRQNPQMDYDLALYLAQPAPYLFLAGSKQLLRHDTRALNNAWTSLASPRLPKAPHVDYHAIATTGGVTPVFVGTDGGIWRYTSSDGWTDLNTPPLNTPSLQTTQFFSITQSPQSFKTLLGGAMDNGTGQTANADAGALSTWNTVDGGDIWFVRYDPDNAAVAYESSNTGIFRSNDGGATWPNNITPPAAIDPIGVLIRDYHAIAIRPDVTNQLLVGSSSGRVLRTRDQGAHWDVAGNFPDIKVMALAYGRDAGGNMNVGYAGLINGDLWETNHINDDNPQWTTGPINGGWGQRKITSVVTDPQQAGVAYLTIGDFIDGTDPGGGPIDVNNKGQVWRTADFGQTWKSISGDHSFADSLPNVPVRSIVIDPTPTAPVEAGFGATGLFVGTDVGVYRGTWNGFRWSWQRYGANFPYVQVDDLQARFYPGTGAILVAGTHGRGAWTINLSDQQPDALPENVAGNPNLGYFYDPCGTAGPYTISINWGDGSPIDTVTGRTAALPGGIISVTGSHPYPRPGPFQPTATVTDPMCGPITLLKRLFVADGALTPQAQSITGSSFTQLNNVTVATFTDADTGAAVPTSAAL